MRLFGGVALAFAPRSGGGGLGLLSAQDTFRSARPATQRARSRGKSTTCYALLLEREQLLLGKLHAVGNRLGGTLRDLSPMPRGGGNIATQ